MRMHLIQLAIVFCLNFSPWLLGATPANSTNLNEKIEGPALQALLQEEMARSKPDYVVYVPKSVDGSTFDTGNEHFLVFDGPDGSLMSVWTQSSFEGAGDHRICFSRSADGGKSWSPPQRLAGSPRKGEKPHQASWGFPMVNKSGRIYVAYNQYQGISDYHAQVTGTMDCVYSDDNGKTWSQPGTVPMKRSPYDHPAAKYPSNWIVWQKPILDLQGRWFTGFTRWVSKAVRTKPHKAPWDAESVVEFMRFMNLDDNPEPKDIKLEWSAAGDKALRVGHYTNPLLSVCQEPSLVRLPDQRLFCTLRTMTGYIWYSISADDGRTWCAPRPLLRQDLGKPILQPIFGCPIYRLADGRYLLVHHPAFGGFDPGNSGGMTSNRRPAFVAVGEFRAKAEQPIWFSESKLLMDNDGVGIGPLKRVDIGSYTSFTTRLGENVLWHPERKFFLLGKRITPEFLTELKVPE